MMTYRTLFGLVFLALLIAQQALPAQSIEGRIPINGTALYVSERGGGEPLLVIHGGPGLNHHYFLPHLQGLEEDFRVIYFDQRACGLSATPSPDSITLALMVEDMEALRKRLSIDRWHILAHSWGVVLAIRYAMVYPEHINKMIFSNAGLLSREYDTEASALVKARSVKSDSVELAAIRGKGYLAISDYEQLFRINFRISAFDRTAMDRLDLHLPKNFPEASSNLFTGLTQDPSFSANLYDSLPKLKSPILIIHGEADIAPPAAVRRLQQEIETSTLVRFNKSGHFPFIEEPEHYQETVRAFLKSKK